MLKHRKILTEKFHYGLVVLLVASATTILLIATTQTISAFRGLGATWPNKQAEWRSGWSQGTSFHNSAVNSAARWDRNYTGRNFRLTEFRGTGPVRILTAATSFAARGWDPTLSGLVRPFAQNGRLVGAELYLNSEWRFNITCTMNPAERRADQEAILTHEFGHTVGLHHDPNHQEAVMWPVYHECRRTLRQDDLSGIQHFYP